MHLGALKRELELRHVFQAKLLAWVGGQEPERVPWAEAGGGETGCIGRRAEKRALRWPGAHARAQKEAARVTRRNSSPRRCAGAGGKGEVCSSFSSCDPSHPSCLCVTAAAGAVAPCHPTHTEKG